MRTGPQRHAGRRSAQSHGSLEAESGTVSTHVTCVISGSGPPGLRSRRRVTQRSGGRTAPAHLDGTQMTENSIAHHPRALTTLSRYRNQRWKCASAIRGNATGSTAAAALPATLATAPRSPRRIHPAPRRQPDERSIPTPPLLYQTSTSTQSGAMSPRSRTLLARTQKVADNGPAGHGDADLGRFTLLTPLP